MNNQDFPDLLASIAASYTRRELDRTVYDRVMASDLGRKLGNLSDGQKYALEFAAYAASAVALKQKDDSSAVMKFLTEVAADAPSEIARRMINGKPEFTRDQLLSVVTELSDADMQDLVAISSDAHSEKASGPRSDCDTTDGVQNSALSDLADRINASKDRIRERRKQR